MKSALRLPGIGNGRKKNARRSMFEISLYKPFNRGNLATRNQINMRNTFFFLSVVALLGALSSGCTNMESKLGRGLSNTAEIVRAGEFRRSMEQTALFDSPETA